MKYRDLRLGEVKRKGDQLMSHERIKNGGIHWLNLRSEIGSKVTALDLSFAVYRRPITLRKRQTQAANKRSLKRAKPRIKCA